MPRPTCDVRPDGNGGWEWSIREGDEQLEYQSGYTGTPAEIETDMLLFCPDEFAPLLRAAIRRTFPNGED